jgi:hypothetical protein
MTSKINITQIVRDHVATLKNEGTGKFSFFDIVIFVVLPFALALIYYAFGWTFSENATSLVVTGMSIFAGLMINVLVLIYTVALNTKTSDETAEEAFVERRFLREIFANISFSIATCVFIVIIVSSTFFTREKAQGILSAIAVFLLGNFLLTLLMTLKRLHILLTKRFS